MVLLLLDLELTYWPLIIGYLKYSESLSLSSSNKYIETLYHDNYRMIYQDYLLSHKAIINEILYLEYNSNNDNYNNNNDNNNINSNNIKNMYNLSYNDTKNICRRLQGLNICKHSCWQKWNFDTNNNSDNDNDNDDEVVNNSGYIEAMEGHCVSLLYQRFIVVTGAWGSQYNNSM